MISNCFGGAESGWRGWTWGDPEISSDPWCRKVSRLRKSRPEGKTGRGKGERHGSPFPLLAPALSPDALLPVQSVDQCESVTFQTRPTQFFYGIKFQVIALNFKIDCFALQVGKVSTTKRIPPQ